MSSPKPLRLVMHIGPHKTATTYMQSNFKHHADALRQRGWLYPAIGERVGSAHHDLSDQGSQFVHRKGPRYDDFRRVIDKADAEGLNVLLSSEGFRKWKPAHFQAVQEVIGERKLHLVYALRDPLDMFYSFWAQKVKTGMVLSLPERMEKHFPDPMHSHLLNPLVEIEPLVKKTSADLTILLYDEMRRRKLDIYTVFMETVLGIGDLPPAERPSSNERLPIEMTEFIRLLSVENEGFGGRGRLHMGDAVRYFFSPEEKAEILRVMELAAPRARRVEEISRESPEFLAVESRLVERLGTYMYPLPDDGRLFSRDPARWVHYDQAELRAVPEVAAVLTKARRKTRSSSPAIVIANLTKRLIIQGRAIRKRFRI